MLVESRKNLLIYVFFLNIFICKGFNLQSENIIYLGTYLLGLVLVFFKMITERYTISEIIKIVLIIALGCVVYIFSKNLTPLFFCINLCCLKNVNINKILKIMFYSTLITMIIMMILSISGIIPNEIYHINRNGILLSRYCFGYIHPNIAHMQFLILVLLYYYLYNNSKKIMMSFIILLLNFILYKYTGSRTACYLIVLFVIYQLFFSNNKIVDNIIKFFSKYSYISLFIFSFVAAYLYNNVGFVQKMDFIFTGRIWYCKRLLELYSIPLFGRENYGPILFDNSYFYLLFKCGLVFTLIYTFFMYKLVEYCLKNDMKKELVFILFLNIFCITENVFLSVNFNFINLFFAKIIFDDNIKIFKNKDGELNE